MNTSLSTKSDKIQNLLSEYLLLDQRSVGTKIQVPEMPVSVSNVEEAEAIQANINNAVKHNDGVIENIIAKRHRKKDIEHQIRGLSPMNVWVPYTVDDKTIYIGFETSDWPMDIPRMMLKYEGEELRKLKHRHISG